MKIAVLSDIHGNIPALEATLADIQHWKPDKVIVNGDTVSRGPYSKKALEMLIHEFPDCTLLAGNHESFVLYCDKNRLKTEHERYHFQCFAQWTADQLGQHWLGEIQNWENHLDLNNLENNRSLHVTHGSHKGNRDGISENTLDGELPEKLGKTRDLFVVSHTHRAMKRHYNGQVIVNTGSVGQPLDQDPRSAYGQFALINGEWNVHIKRVDYNKVQAEKDFHESGFMDAGGPVAQLILLEHRHNTPYVGPFMHQYLPLIEDNKISLSHAVNTYLTQR